MPSSTATMAVNSNNTRSPVVTGTPHDPATRRSCSMLKRVVLTISNLINIGLISSYLSLAGKHRTVIQNNPTLLAIPFAYFDFAQERIGFFVSLGRLIYFTACIPTILIVPEHILTVLLLLNLCFEIPLAIVAESVFGQQLTYSDLNPGQQYISCFANSSFTTQQLQFWAAYGRRVGQAGYLVCKDFMQEGSMLRASLLVPWFGISICFILIAVTFTLYVPYETKRWTDFFVFLTGFDSTAFSCGKLVNRASWSMKMPKFKVKMPTWRQNKARRIETSSDVSTLVNEEAVVVKVDEKDGIIV